jgi:hypothetical protein
VSILAQPDTTSAGVTHLDSKAGEGFAISNLTQGGAPGTQYYDMTGVPVRPTIKDLKNAGLFGPAPQSLLDKMDAND